MLKTYHICYTSHREVMYRNEDDMNRSFNSLCSALYKTGSRCLAENDLTDHHHGCYQTECPEELVRSKRISYTRLFNEKYGRTGPLGESGFFMMELQGIRHTLAALSYVIKNTVHHGITSTPFEWPYCSANAYFRRELGKEYTPEILLTPTQIEAVLPRRAAYDPKWKMGVDGVFLRETVIETSVVENLFATPQAFNYLISRKSAADWYKEQEADRNGIPPVTLENIETRMLDYAASQEQAISEMLRNEAARHARRGIKDLELCKIIDSQYVPRYKVFSVYHLSEAQKNAIANEVYHCFHIGTAQLRRCLVF